MQSVACETAEMLAGMDQLRAHSVVSPTVPEVASDCNLRGLRDCMAFVKSL